MEPPLPPEEATATLLPTHHYKPYHLPLLVICTTVTSFLAVASFSIAINSLRQPPPGNVNVLYASNMFAEVFRFAPVCGSPGPSYREGWSFGWPQYTKPSHPLRYGVWFVLVPPNTTNVFINVGRSMRVESRDELEEEIGRDTYWCSRAHELGYDSIQTRVGHKYSELVMCDDVHNRVANVGPCTPELYRKHSGHLEPCNCSDIMSVVNCNGLDGSTQSCEDAMLEMHRLFV
jgi:hypothetical protein